MRNLWARIRGEDNFLRFLVRLTIISSLSAVAIWVVGGLVLGVLVGVPSTPKEIIASVENPDNYILRAESVRVLEADKDQLISNRIVTTNVDLKNNKVQMDIAGFAPQIMRVLADGKRTILQTDEDYVSLDNISAKQVRGPTAADLQKFKPTIKTDRAELVGEQAWVLSFKPSCSYLSQIMLVSAIPDIMEISSTEKEAFASGKCKVEWAYAWIGVKSRQIKMVDLKFSVEDGADYQYLFKFFAPEEPYLFKDLKIEESAEE